MSAIVAIFRGGHGSLDLPGLGAEGMYFLESAKFIYVSIEFLEFATGKITSLMDSREEQGWGLSLSSDGKSMVYIQDEICRIHRKREVAVPK